MRAVWRLRIVCTRMLCWVIGLRPLRVVFTRALASISLRELWLFLVFGVVREIGADLLAWRPRFPPSVPRRPFYRGPVLGFRSSFCFKRKKRLMWPNSTKNLETSSTMQVHLRS